MSGRQPWNDEIVETEIARFDSAPENLVQILRALLERFGYIDARAIPMLAERLNLSRADVHGVVSFYHDFRREPPGRHAVKLCQAEACQSVGCRTLTDHVKASLDVDFHGTSADGLFTLEPVYCLGNCACSPAMMVDEAVYGRVDAQRFDEIIASYREAGR